MCACLIVYYTHRLEVFVFIWLSCVHSWCSRCFMLFYAQRSKVQNPKDSEISPEAELWVAEGYLYIPYSSLASISFPQVCCGGFSTWNWNCFDTLWLKIQRRLQISGSKVMVMALTHERASQWDHFKQNWRDGVAPRDTKNFSIILWRFALKNHRHWTSGDFLTYSEVCINLACTSKQAQLQQLQRTTR